jgi:hypothetical protein
MNVHLYWLATFEYLNDRRDVRSLDLTFQSPGFPAAVRDAARFWANRARVLPDVFARPLCFKLYAYTIPTILDDGSLSGPTLGIFNAEWKVDTAGRSLADWAEAQAAQFEARYGAKS